MTNLPQKSTEDLCSITECAYQAIEKAFELKAREEQCRYEAIKEREKAVNAKKKKKRDVVMIPFFVFGPFFGALFLVTYFIAYSLSFLGLGDAFLNYIDYGDPIALIILILLVDIVICILLSIREYKNPLEKNCLDNAEEAERNAERAVQEYQLVLQGERKYIEIIAPEYRYPLAAKELATIIRQGRATTLPEAYDKLELKLHQMKVEEGMAAIIATQIVQAELLKEIKYNTDWI